MKKKKQQKKIEIEKYLPGLFARTEGYASNVSKYYTAAVNALLDLAADVDLEPEEVFYFADHKKLSVKATNVLRGLYSAVYQEIRRGVIAEWEFANLSNDAMIESILGKGLKDDNHYARWFSRNHDAMDAFFKRKSEYGGLNLSQKVWKYTSQFKEEMELALSASLGRGDSAATVSRHVRQYLQEPDRLFRRVRDEEGNLKLSKRAAAYHPGRGEYRSSYKNAMRLARTETNMAYRAADNERWSQLDFVVGIEVKRSKRKFPCKICEALAGKFPKDFDFRGWHPQCRCYAVPILCSMDEMIAMQKRLLNDEEPGDFHSSNEVTEPHEDFKKWVKDNQERIDEAAQRGTLPYWMKDNPKFLTNTAAASRPLDAAVRERRNEIREEAKVLFKDNTLSHPSIGSPITVPNSAVKEWLNQPFEEFAAKNELLLELPDKFDKTTYLGVTSDSKNRQDVVGSHIFETEVNGKKGWIIVHEMKWGEMKLHSISDSENAKPK